MSKDGIPMDEWVLELERLSAKSAEGFTASEWADRMGVSLYCARGRLKKAQALGWLVVGKRSSSFIDGRIGTTPVYQVVKPKGGKR